MLKNLTQLEHKIGDKIYQFLCEPTSPLAEVKEALFQFHKYVGKIEDQIKAMQDQEVEKSKENVPNDEVKEKPKPAE